MDAFKRAKQFGKDHANDFKTKPDATGPTKPQKLFTELSAVIEGAEGKHAVQLGGAVGAATTDKSVLRDALMSDLRSITGSVGYLSEEQKDPAMLERFRLPDGHNDAELVGKARESATQAPVVVLVMDRDRVGDYQAMTQKLRDAGIRAEMYLGTSGMKAQMKYADRRGAPLAIIQGGDEKAKGEVTIKDLRLGAELAKGIETREAYAGQRLAQVTVKEADLVEEVRRQLGVERAKQ